MFAEFTNDLATGNEMIDSQHKELISRINALFLILENGDDQREVMKMLNFLSDYTKYHFSAEEELQREIGYPGYIAHVQQHEALTKVVADLQALLDEEAENYDVFIKILKEEIVDWLLYHINGFDRSVAEYKYIRDNPGLL